MVDIVELLRDEAAKVAIERAGVKGVSSKDVTGSIIWRAADEIEALRQVAPTPPPTHISVGSFPLLEVAEGIAKVMGYAEWACPEHAEEQFNELIKTYYPKLQAAIAAQAAPADQLAAEVLTVDMDAPLTAVDRLRTLAGGSRDIAFEPSDADEILEKLEALAAILSAPNLEIGDAPAPAEHVAGVKEWDYKDRAAIQKGEVRSYEGRLFKASRDIPADTDTNAPGYSGFWREVE